MKEIVAVSGAVSSGSTVITIGSGFNQPDSVAVDSAGNVFVADSESAAEKIVAVNGVVSSSSTVIKLGSGLNSPGGVAMDSAGNVYVGDSNNNAVKEIGLAMPLDLGTVPAAASASPLTLGFTFDSAGTIDVPAVLTQGAAGLDFVDAGTGTCTTNGTTHAYSVGDCCTVGVSFTPIASGARFGAATLNNSSGVAIATEYVAGMGTGPQVTFGPAKKSIVNGNFLTPLSVAMDGSGNLFVDDTYNNAVDELLKTGGYATIHPIGGSFTFNHPEGIAIDGSGNVFVADSNNNAVQEILAAGGYATVNVLGGSFNFNTPYEVAVDASGNVFVTENAGNAVVEILVAGGYTTVVPVQTGFNGPQGIAIDALGNLFVADTLNNAVKEILASGGYTSVVTLGGSF